MPLWTPANLTTPATAWYKADALVLNDGDVVSSWTDSTGGSNALAQATGFRQPTYKTSIQNSLPVVRFDRTLGQFLHKAFTLAQPLSYYIVAEYSLAFASNAVLIDGETVISDALYRSASTTMSLYSGSTSCNLTTTPQSWHVFGAEFSGASSTLRADGNTAATGNPGSTAANGISVGASSDASQPSGPDVGEIAVLNYVASTADRQLIEGYLCWKWGLQANLPANHPYFAAAPTFGVAGDDEHSITLAQRSANTRWLVPRFYGTEEIMPLLEGPGIVTATHARVGHGPRILAKLSTAPRIRARLVLEPQK